jgi:hypothetical protein
MYSSRASQCDDAHIFEAQELALLKVISGTACESNIAKFFPRDNCTDAETLAECLR